jgi:hypothetical protein
MHRTFPAALLCLALLAGCNNQNRTQPAQAAAEPGAGSVQVVNSMCPIGSHEWDGTRTRAEGWTREWNGSRIGFCCLTCVRKFDAMTDEQKAQVLAAATANRPL